MNQFSTEQDIMKALQITSRQLRKLRRANQIPFLRISRFVRVYDLEQVIKALEIGVNGTTTAKQP